ncbi:MAG: hypothetical protein FRX48_00018 [Lasallia pustulata]|uniref:Uncharacterized protein n=1 Tax=Lasallia pustulata TaxID=136370 RepID=A0A5M8Q2B3_9LECA|nr:MAG: hypothetical protein FRX48_00018 [Lasallia pustulata]
MHIHSPLLALALAPLVRALVATDTCCTAAVPASTHTITVTATGTTTVTVTAETTRTSYKFLPGNPPTSSVPLLKNRPATPGAVDQAADAILPRNNCNADDCLRALSRHTGAPFCATYTQTTNTATTGLPTYIPPQCNPSRISSACSCLSSTSPTSTTTTSCSCPLASIPATYTTITIALATTTVSPAPITQTIYPCADPLPSPGPAYGDHTDSSDLGLSNSLYSLSTP